MDTNRFRGVYTALITPMCDGEVCYEDYAKLIEHQVDGNIDGIATMGTTGESPTFEMDEHLKVIGKTIEFANGRVPVVAGTGANSTKEAIHLTKGAHKLGADAMLIVAPYYNKPSQEGVFQHFCAVAEETDKPIILYSIPSRCGIEIAIDTVVRLAEKYPHIRTIKEAGGSCDRVSQLVQALGNDITILSGDDALTLPFMSLGATGVISVASNLVVADLVKMVKLALDNDYANAAVFARKYYRLFTNLFIESNPVPVKYALSRAGIISSPEVRLPLAELQASSISLLNETLKEVGL